MSSRTNNIMYGTGSTNDESNNLLNLFGSDYMRYACYVLIALVTFYIIFIIMRKYNWKITQNSIGNWLADKLPFVE